MNNIVIKGRLAKNPEMTSVNVKGDSKSVTKFDVAVNRTFGEGADFFNCVVWGKTAEFVNKFFSKGQEILVSGSMQQRKWQDKEGNNRYSWDLNASQVEFCGSKGDKAESTGSAPEGFEEIDEDIPF